MPTTLDAQYFWANHPGGEAWLRRYESSGRDELYQWALDGLQSLGTVSTVLELGCHCGPLLRRLESAGYEAAGFDVNGEAVARARSQGLHAAVGTVPDVLRRFDDGSVDAVVACYCLSYIAPPDLAHVLAECLRVARVGLVLVEPQSHGAVPEHELVDGPYVEWRHNYVEAVERARASLPNDPRLETMLRPVGPAYDINGVLVARWA
jgi:SAM-dependent methyltransferase